MKLAVVVALVSAMVVPAAADADGLPLPVENVGPKGVATIGGRYRFVTIKAGPDTVVERIEQDGGAVSDSIRLDGLYTVPAVALDGSAGGLSADGGTLILIRPRPSFPRKTTEFVRFDTDDLRSPEPFRLDGDFSFDALSPDGRTMYLINYLSPRDPTEYRVRAFDLDSDRLQPGAVVDPDETGDEMYGFALSRETSPDGRWAYTLYGGGKETFIHALDTEGATAVCVDLEDVNASDLYRLGLDLDPASGLLTVLDGGKPVAIVDPETFSVGEPPAADVARAVADGTTDPSRASWVEWAAIGGGLALVAALAVLIGRRRRPAADVDEEALERLVRTDADQRGREQAEREPAR